MSVFHIVKTAVFMLTLLPLRVVCFLIILLTYYVIVRVFIVGCRDPDRACRHGTFSRRVLVGLTRMAARAILLTMGYLWIEVSGQRDHSVPTVVANHLSYMDILFHLALFSPSFVAKAYVRSIPIVGLIARALGSVFVVPRSARPPPGTPPQDPVTAVRRRMAQPNPGPLVIYPEGTTTNGFFITKFHVGAFLAKQPVQPCALQFIWSDFSPTWESVPFGMHFVCNFTTLWQRVRVTYLPPHHPTPAEQANPAEFALSVQRAIAAATGLPVSAAYARHKFEYHAHVRADRLAWQWHRNDLSSRSALVAAIARGDTTAAEAEAGEGSPGISPVRDPDPARDWEEFQRRQAERAGPASGRGVGPDRGSARDASAAEEEGSELPTPPTDAAATPAQPSPQSG